MTLRRLPGVSADDEAGNVTLLSLGLLVVLLSLILVIASATAVQLTRVRLLHLADELALDAADSLDLDAYYRGDIADLDDGTVLLGEQRMQATVADHLGDASDRHGLEGAQAVLVATPDGATAVVQVQVTVDPLFGVSALLPFTDGITLTAESSARAS